MKTLSEMTVLELLDEEAKASLKLSQSPAGSNAQRVADRRLDNVLAEMQSRTAEPVLSASTILACVMTLCLLVLSACGGSPGATSEAVITCTLVASGAQDMVVRFSDKDIQAPGGTACVSLGGGEFDCKPDWCTAGEFPGTCPDCPGGGE